VSTIHAVNGAALVTLNALAAAVGVYAWWRVEPNRAFWPLLRAGQVLLVVQAALGFVLLSSGEEPETLHLVYGLVPLGIAFVAEQLRIASAQTVLDQLGIESTQAVGDLPEAEQRSLVLQIVRREIGVMAASAGVIALLGLRAAGWL
jgi:hypothetical protein